MKTAIKITAIAVITVLAALSCTPEVTLSPRDYSDYKDQYKAEYTNSGLNSTGITFNYSSLLYSTTTPAPDYTKEITVNFPSSADVLKTSNANIVGEMQKFLTFNTYTDPPGTSTNYTKSTLGSSLNYTFVERTGLTSITVRLDSLPTPKVAYIVAKIDASNYKRNGQLIDRNRDGVGGDIYDDEYQTISIWDSGTTTPSGTFSPPVQTYDLSLNLLSFNLSSFNADTPTSQYFQIADFGYNNTELRTKILDGIKDKIKVEKYNKASNTWEPGTATIAVHDKDMTAPTGSGLTRDCVYVAMSSFEDLGIYRVKATGLANLQSTANIGDQPAKVSVNGSFRQDTYYSAPTISISDKRANNYVDTSNLTTFSSGTNVTSDAHKQDVVIEWYVQGVTNNNSSPANQSYPKQLSTDEFNKAVKLVYAKSGSVNLPGQIDNLVELKIKDVDYQIDKRNDPTATKYNKIVITLDGYQFSPARNRSINILINPNFKYDVETITFGGQGVNFYDGQFFWGNYGQLITTGM